MNTVYPQSHVFEQKIPHLQQNDMPTPPSGVETTRLAPSPTGALHLGNGFSFLTNWAIARKRGWKIALRIEDLDTPRVKPGVIDQTIRTLEWLGLDWDSGPKTQTDDLQIYHNAMHQLAQKQVIYPCELTRSQIEEAASAPHVGDADDHETRFDPSLRPQSIPHVFTEQSSNWRLQVMDESIMYHDQLQGKQEFNLHQLIGDFVVWTKRATPSYQLAVVIDDALAGVTQVVRGSDLLDSAARQLYLYTLLDLTPIPTYTHLPLIRGHDGRRLAKRHGDTRIDSYILQGVTQERIIGLIAYWTGTLQEKTPMSLDEFLNAFSFDTLPKSDLVFTQEDHQWLIA